MESLDAELERARDLDVEELADAIESIGFECTRCGGCCTGEDEDAHTATVFPDEVRELQDSEDYDWRDVARPMPYGLEESGDASDGSAELQGSTFEWALQTDACGDCAFYEERPEESADDDSDDGTDHGSGDGTDHGSGDGTDHGSGDGTDHGSGDGTDHGSGDGSPDDAGPGYCTVHEDRPLICQTYPFSVALGGTTQPMGEAVDEAGMVRAHECEGLGRDIEREDAEELAAALKERAVRELEEAIGVREQYEHVEPGPGEVVVHDSEGAKDVDGQPIDGS